MHARVKISQSSAEKFKLIQRMGNFCLFRLIFTPPKIEISQSKLDNLIQFVTPVRMKGSLRPTKTIKNTMPETKKSKSDCKICKKPEIGTYYIVQCGPSMTFTCYNYKR